jgi:hypothetical protein
MTRDKVNIYLLVMIIVFEVWGCISLLPSYLKLQSIQGSSVDVASGSAVIATEGGIASEAPAEEIVGDEEVVITAEPSTAASIVFEELSIKEKKNKTKKIRKIGLESVAKMLGFSEDEKWDVSVGAYFEEVQPKNFTMNGLDGVFTEWHDGKRKRLNVTFQLSSDAGVSKEEVLWILNKYCSDTSWYVYDKSYNYKKFKSGECSVRNDGGTMVNIGIIIKNADINEGYVNVDYELLK